MYHSSNFKVLFKSFLREVLPPFITSMIRKFKSKSQVQVLMTNSISAEKKKEILDQAKRNLNSFPCVSVDILGIPVSHKWNICRHKIRDDVQKIKTVEKAIFYGQGKVLGQAIFDHRTIASPDLCFTNDYTLKSEFPMFQDAISSLGDSVYSLPETLFKDSGRLLSNVFFWQMRIVCQCLAYIHKPRVVCEIGGGYGGTARLWKINPIHPIETYIIVDFPESLFFAEVFLRVNLPDCNVFYVQNADSIKPFLEKNYDVILCPINYVESLREIDLDIVINTGSMQEMTSEWVDFWMTWLENQSCDYFYSLNYFAQPINNMFDAANFWSPKLPRNWVVRLQNYNPALVKQQTSANFAEILAEKVSGQASSIDGLSLSYHDLLNGRFIDGQVLLEAMDIVRIYPKEEFILDLIRRCEVDLKYVPKEVYYLVLYLLKNSTKNFLDINADELLRFRLKFESLLTQGSKELLHEPVDTLTKS